MTEQMLTSATETPVQRPLRLTSKALPQHNRVHNRSLLLQTLYRQGAMSRADLARSSGLTRPTVSALISELSDDGVVSDLGRSGELRSGKPSTLVGVHPDGCHIVTLDLSSADRFVGAVVNLRGETIDLREVSLGGATGEDALGLVIRLTEQLASRTHRRILGIGVGTPGIIDEHGVVLEAVHLGWQNLPLAQVLEENFAVPVHVGNDANAAALGVHTFRDMPGMSLMVVTIEHGVGVGLIIGGALVKGEQFSAGEIGHVTAGDKGERCACGREDCLELALAAPQLRAKLAAASPADRDRVLGEAGRALGTVLAPIISALNLNEVVLSGPADLIEGPLLSTAESTIRARTLGAISHGLQMRAATAGDNLVLLGGAASVLAVELGVS